ncbi:MAG: M16 family metallopeptidase [Gammaproteobacteria bacterium]
MLRKIARDNTTIALLVALLLLGLFVAWQVTRLSGSGTSTHLSIASAVTGSSGVPATVAALEGTAVSRPRLPLQRWQTSNGARVYFVQAPELPMLDVRVLFDAGSARDGLDPGLARLTAAMIGEGTPTHSVDEINEGFEAVGAEFSATSYRDMAVVELRSLTAPELLAPALALFTDVVAHPSFPGEEVERIRGQMLVGLERDEEEPATIAARSFMAALYMVHPYAMPPEGTVASVRGIRAEDLRNFHQRYYTARNAVIAIAGAVDRAQATQIAEMFSTALAAGTPAPELPVPPAPTGGNFHVKFDSKQTHILIGLPAIRRNDPDEAALDIANQVLGGDGLTSLLGEEIRNKRGLAYSAGSSFRAMRSVGPFSIQMQTRNDAAGEALGVSLETVRQFAKTGPTPQQLEDARRQLVGSYPLQLAGNHSIVSTLGTLGFYGLPDDYLEQQLAKIEKLSAEEVRAAFVRHVPVDRLMVVTLGPDKPVAKVTPPKPGAATRPAQ